MTAKPGPVTCDHAFCDNVANVCHPKEWAEPKPEATALSEEELADELHAAFDDAAWKLLERDGPEKVRRLFERVVAEWREEERLWRQG